MYLSVTVDAFANVYVHVCTFVYVHVYVPVVPNKAVVEVSSIGSL